MFDQAKRWIVSLIDLGLALIALGIVVSVLVTGTTGSTTGFFGIGTVTKGISDLLTTLSGLGLVGLITLGIILWLFRGRSAG